MKTYVITLSKVFLKGHPKAGQPTNFKEKFLAGEKIHTIRAGAYWEKVAAEVAAGRAQISIRQWTGKPYQSKQEIIKVIDREDGVGVQSFEFRPGHPCCYPILNGRNICPDTLCDVSENDGLSKSDFLAWFNYPKAFTGNILHFTPFRY